MPPSRGPFGRRRMREIFRRPRPPRRACRRGSRRRSRRPRRSNRSEPASEPVCASAALRLSSVPPILTATTGLPASRAYSQARRNSAGVPDRLDEAGDHPHLRIVGEIADVVRRVEPDLVAAADRIAGLDAARVHARAGSPSRCRRSGRRWRPARSRARAMRSSGMVIKRCGAARLPRQLGPDTARPASSIACRSRTASSRPLGSPPSPKPPENTVALRAFTLPASRDGVDRGRARHDHHHMVGRLRQVGERRVAGLAVPHRLVARIDRIDRAGEVEAAQRSGTPASTSCRAGRSRPRWRRCAD